MRLELERALDCVYAALNWWLEGLWIGLPARARSALFTERAELVVNLAGGLVTAGAHDTNRVELDASEANAKAALTQLVPDGQVPDVTLLLPRSAVLTHTLRLPAAAESELRDALRHELDRLTPFAIDDLAFDYYVRERSGTALLVEVALLRQAALDESTATLERLGLRATAATTADEDGIPLPLNLLPHRRRLRLPAARLSLRPALALGAALMLGTALYVPLPRYDRALASQSAIVETVRIEAVAARDRLAEREAALASGELLTQRRRGYVPSVVLLRELTAQIPEHTWLSRLAISRSEVQLQGESAAATELLQLLESSELLRDVQFQAPVARSGESGKEQFSIAAKLAWSAP